MARIAGVDLPRGKRIEIALTYIYGIGRTRALTILDKAKVDEGIKVKDLSEPEVEKLRGEIAKLTVEGDLRRGCHARRVPDGCFAHHLATKMQRAVSNQQDKYQEV